MCVTKRTIFHLSRSFFFSFFKEERKKNKCFFFSLVPSLEFFSPSGQRGMKEREREKGKKSWERGGMRGMDAAGET